LTSEVKRSHSDSHGIYYAYTYSNDKSKKCEITNWCFKFRVA